MATQLFHKSIESITRHATLVSMPNGHRTRPQIMSDEFAKHPIVCLHMQVMVMREVY